ncbi:MAG: ferrous iron transport protein B [Bacillota bacterium]
MAKENPAKEEKMFTIALAGNPNAGKTSIFNHLTGSKQHVGNWPGVTVEIKEGSLFHQGRRLKVVDLPGTYSLGAYSEDEVIARNFIVMEHPDLVINVVDLTNLERNLYLTLQLLELGLPVVLALNMYDQAENHGIKVDLAKLSGMLELPVIPTVATRGEGSRELIEAAVSIRLPKTGSFKVDYGKEVEHALVVLDQFLARQAVPAWSPGNRWLALKLLAKDEAVWQAVRHMPAGSALLKEVDDLRGRLERKLNDDVETVITDRRYRLIQEIAALCITRKTENGEPVSLSDRIDAVVTNRFLGLPLFLLAMWAVFQFSFTLADPFIGFIEGSFTRLGEVVAVLLAGVNAPAVLIALVVDGVIAGVGSVLVFVPNIFLLFLAISLLEDSGYMARAAFIMDRFMHGIGLHGRSFIPMLLGFGCNVPAIMATRTLDNKKDRFLTILINPLMSCSARLPIYVLFVGAFFSASRGLIIASLYLLGFILAIVVGRLFKTFLFAGDTSPFLMELPPYRLPTVKSLFIHMWDRGSGFLRRAATVIITASIVIWALANLPWGVEFASAESLLGRIGTVFAPLLSLAGFGRWEAAAALIFGLLAKEVVVSTLAVIYGAAETGLTEVIAAAWTPLSAYAFMVMTLIYIPCVATIAAIRKETNSWGWTGFAVGYSLLLGWLMAILVFQLGRLLGFS